MPISGYANSIILNSVYHNNDISKRVDSLIVESKALFGHNFKKSEILALAALRLSEEINYTEGIGTANIEAGRACIYLSKMSEATNHFEEANKIFMDPFDTVKIADLRRMQGIIVLNLAQYDKAINLFQEGDSLSELMGDNAGRAFNIMDIGIAYIYLSGREKAMEYFLDALIYAEESGDRNAIGNVKNSIGQILFEQEKYLETRTAMEESLELALAIDNPILISDCNFYLARVELEFQNYQRALQLNSESLRIDSIQGNLRGLAHKHILNGDIYLLQNNLRAAENSFSISKHFCDQIQDKEQTLTKVLIRQGTVDRLFGRLDQAILRLNEAVSVSKQGKLMYWEFEAYENLALTYEQLGDYVKAFKYQKLFSSVKDSVINTERNEDFNRLQAFYEDEQNKAEIQRLSNESKLQSAISAQKTQQNLLLSAGIAFLVIILFVLWILFRNKAKSNELLSVQKAEIGEQNKQKEILLKEIHHRVKNNLQVISSLLSLQSNNILDSQALNAVKEGQNRVKSIALIHQKLYQQEDISRVDFEEYAEELISYIQSTYSQEQKKIDVKVEAPNLDLDIDTAVPLGLILNELVSNSFKYAFENRESGEISVTLEKIESKGKIQMIVSDDGIGIPTTLDANELTSLGLKLVHMLARQLDGTAKILNGVGSKWDVLVSTTDYRKNLD